MTKLHSYQPFLIQFHRQLHHRSELITVQPSASVSASFNGKLFQALFELFNKSFICCDVYFLANIKKGIM
jgi:hypothetical protein